LSLEKEDINPLEILYMTGDNTVYIYASKIYPVLLESAV
jgi:hypothetical protein